MNEKMCDALNSQLNNEYYSAYLYLSMSAYCSSLGLDGFAHWFRFQYDEEILHAMKLYSFIEDRGGRVHLQAIQEPPKDFASPVAVFEQSYEHEQFITRCINDLVDLAVEEKDHTTNTFLSWYLSEQVEEESNVSAIVAKLKFVGDDGRALLMIDSELASRQASTAAAE